MNKKAPSLQKKKIMVVPTGHGWAFLGAIFLILLTGASYDNNLVYFLAFFLFSMSLISGVHAYRNLRGIEVQLLSAQDVEAGQPAPLEFQLQGGESPHESIELDAEDRSWRLKKTRIEGLNPKDVEKAVLLLQPQNRGRYQIPAIYLQTRYPLGLFLARKKLHFEHSIFYYPKAVGQVELPEEEASGAVRHMQAQQSDGSDFYEHRYYQKGDPMSRVDWKGYARTGDMLVKRYKAPVHEVLRFQLEQTPGADLEAKLSQLSLWLNEALRKEARYELILPERRFSYGHGLRHYQDCQRALATYGGGL